MSCTQTDGADRWQTLRDEGLKAMEPVGQHTLASIKEAVLAVRSLLDVVVTGLDRMGAGQSGGHPARKIEVEEGSSVSEGSGP